MWKGKQASAAANFWCFCFPSPLRASSLSKTCISQRRTLSDFQAMSNCIGHPCTCGWTGVFGCCMEQCKVDVRCSLPGGGLAFTGVANIRSCRPGSPGSAEVHIFLGWWFWCQLPDPAPCGHRGCCVRKGGWAQWRRRRRWDQPRPGWLPLPCSLGLQLTHSFGIWNVAAVTYSKGKIQDFCNVILNYFKC